MSCQILSIDEPRVHYSEERRSVGRRGPRKCEMPKAGDVCLVKNVSISISIFNPVLCLRGGLNR
jgi:hypothetical protein